MGACYSTNGRGGKDPYIVCPSEMPQSSPEHRHLLGPSRNHQQHNPALQKPYGGRYGFQVVNSNQQSSDRAALSSISQQETDNNQDNMNRFGFAKSNNKRGDNNSNPQKCSTDSLVSTGSTASRRQKGPGSTESQRRNKRTFSFNPKDSDKFRMIDDSSSANSGSRKGSTRTSSPTKSVKSTTSTVKEETQAAEDIINANIAKPSQSSAPARNSNTPNGANEKKTNGSRLGNFARFRGTFSRSNTLPDKATKAPVIKEPPKVNREQPQGQGRGKNAKQNDANDKSTSSRFLRKGFFSKQKSLPDRSSHKLSSSASADAAAIQSPPADVPKSQTAHPLSPCPEPTPKPTLPNLGNPVLQQKLVEKSQKLPEGTAPIAMIDSLETTSIGSLDGDDLMLDTDVLLDDYEDPPHLSTGKVTSLPRSRSRSGSRSKSRDSLDTPVNAPSTSSALPSSSHDVKTSEKKPPFMRRHTEGSMKKRGEDRNVRSLETEPIQELANLLSSNPQTTSSRHPKLNTSTRPASFPGPRAGRPSTLLRPPRQASMGGAGSGLPGEDGGEPGAGGGTVVDGYTYRQLLQELTTTKTMLLRLKRLLQDDELGSPMTAAGPWSLNGFKLGSSQPSTPATCPDIDSKFQFAAGAGGGDGEGGQSMEALLQENAELRQQLKFQQHQIEEQERTIKLLQQQMTKYEFIDSEEGGKCYTHTSTQTEKCGLPASVEVAAPLAASASIGSRYRQNTELSSLTEEKDTLEDDKIVSMVESGIDMTSPNSELLPPHPHSPFSLELSMETSTTSMENSTTHSMEKAAYESTEKLMADIPEEDLGGPVVIDKRLVSLEETDDMSQSQIFERNVMAQLEEEELDADCCETMEELEKPAIRSPPIATEIQIEKYIIAKHAVRPDLLKGVDHILHEDSDQDSIEVTAKDCSHTSHQEALKVEKESRDSGLGFRMCEAAVCGAGLDYSPSDTSSFSLAVISTEIDGPDTEEEESDLPLDTPPPKDLPLFGVADGMHAMMNGKIREEDEEEEDDEKSQIVVLRSSAKPKNRRNMNSTFCVEEEDVITELVPGAGEELAQPDEVVAEVHFVKPKPNGLFVVDDDIDKITKDLAEVEDCMNRTKDLNDAENYLNKSSIVSDNSDVSGSDKTRNTDSALDRSFSPTRTFPLNESIREKNQQVVNDSSVSGYGSDDMHVSPMRQHSHNGFGTRSQTLPVYNRAVSYPEGAVVNGGSPSCRLPGPNKSSSLPRASIPRPAAPAIPRPAIPRPSGAGRSKPPTKLPLLGLQRVNKTGVMLRSFAGVAQK